LLPSRLRSTLAALSVGLVLATAAHSAESSAMSDVALARSALALVDSDPQLRDVNLVVSVVDRVAVIGGPVPSDDVGRRAESLVRQVSGIKAVKNHCFVQSGPGALIRAAAGSLPERQPFLTDLPGILPGTKWTAWNSESSAAEPGSFALAHPGEKAVVVRRPSNPADNILLGPVGADPAAGGFLSHSRPYSPVPRARLTSVPPAPAPVVLPAGPRDPRAAAAMIRAADPRFAGLKLEIVNGMLVISGTAKRSSDAWDLARQLRDVPGISRVVIGTVELR
jgi:hypothetical protein